MKVEVGKRDNIDKTQEKQNKKSDNRNKNDNTTKWTISK